MATTTPPTTAPGDAVPPPPSEKPSGSLALSSSAVRKSSTTTPASSSAKAQQEQNDGPAKISAVVKKAASLAPKNKMIATKDPKKDAGNTPSGTGGTDPIGDEPSRKRSRVDNKETVDGNKDKIDDNEPRPFTSLPFYGDHKRAISSLSFAPSSSAASRRNNGGMSLNSNAGHLPAVLCASSSADGSAKVWDITKNLHADAQNTSDPAKKKKFYGSSTSPTSAFTSTATRLDPKLSLFGHNRGINDVAWSPTALYLATASDDKTLRLWSAETGDAFVEFRGHTNFVFSCRFNPQSNLLVSGSFDETVKLWDVRCGECVATLPAHSNPVTGVDFNRDGTCIVSGSYDGLVRIWDTATGECLKTVYAEGNPPVGGVRFSPNGKFVLSGTLDSKLRLYDVSGGRERGTFGNEYKGLHTSRPQPRGGKCSKTYAGHANGKFCAFAAFLSSNPKRQCVVSGSEDGKVYLYDLQSRLMRQTLEGHNDAVLAVDAHDSLELIGSGGMANDKHVRFWAPSTVEN